MLIGLLPAFRNLRAPLIGGYLLLLTIWLLLWRDIPTSEGSSSEAVKAFRDLDGYTGRTGQLVAATFVAYVMGSVAQHSVVILGEVRNYFRNGPQQDVEDIKVLATYVDDLVKDHPRLLNAARREPGSEDSSDGELHQMMLGGVQREIPRIARRMRGEQNELYDEYDRLIGEAELREAVLIPLLLLILVLGATWSFFALALAVVLPVLKLQASSQRQAANSVVVDAVVVGKVQAPTLERIQRRAVADDTKPDEPKLESARWRSIASKLATLINPGKAVGHD